MEIKRGRFILCSDEACCWVAEEKTSKNGTVRNECISGYYPNFRMLATEGLPSHLIRSSEAKSFKKLVEDVKHLEERIAALSLKKVKELEDDIDRPIP